ncbi:MAG: hypothetical protein F6J90_40225 [Moorea sp. SIOASIH]|uniref:hypothetical protein n=1 Tax=Moorena sp. SIOASIH TaxID=2607817 RepID=UPI0013BC1300|nr:hypothetical protein [Moorena sp. SIOASIH]NEO42218.1 hypothetical protein [Moorena sp. SIOASIH]
MGETTAVAGGTAVAHGGDHGSRSWGKPRQSLMGETPCSLAASPVPLLPPLFPCCLPCSLAASPRPHCLPCSLAASPVPLLPRYVQTPKNMYYIIL